MHDEKDTSMTIKLLAGIAGTLLITAGAQAQQGQTRVTAGSPAQFERLGTVSLEGNYMLAGAPGDSTQGLQTGAVYVYERNFGGTGAWGERQKLLASNPTNAAAFGSDVSIAGGRAFIGSSVENSNGALYIFQRSVNTWSEYLRIPSPNTNVNAAYGTSVEARGTRVLVGSPEVYGSTAPGHAYMYEQNVGGFNQWGLLKLLEATPPVARESFGEAVALDTNTCIVGAIGADELTVNAGAAYIFDRNQGGANNWGQVKRLVPSSPFPSGHFGETVSISGDYAFVGAPGEFFSQGAVYIFWRFQGGVNNWGEVARIIAPQTTSVGRFGSSVSVLGNRAFVGEEDGPCGGTTYLLEQTTIGGPWVIVKGFNADNFGSSDDFGDDVEMDGLDGVVGAPGPVLTGQTFAGAGFHINVPQLITANPYGFCHNGGTCGNADPDAGCVNSTGQGALLTATGSSSVASDDLVLTTTQMPNNTFGIVFMGSTKSQIFLGDGLRVAGGQIIRVTGAINSGPGGQLIYGPGIAAGQAAITSGTTWNFQTWFRDNGGPCGQGTNLSNGMSVSFLP